MNTRINNLPTGTLSDSDYIPFDGSGGTKKVAGSLITNKADKVSSVTTGDLASLTSAGDLADSGYKGSYFGDLGNAIGMRGWNQLNANDGASGSNGGITFTNNGDGSWTLNGTSTSAATWNINQYNNGKMKFIAGHKYAIIGPSRINNTITIFTASTASAIYTGVDNIFTCATSSDGAAWMRFEFAAGATYSNLNVYPILIDLTALFGSGNEPSTVAEFRAMFPADYYPYCRGDNGTIDLGYLSASTTRAAIEAICSSLIAIMEVGEFVNFNITVPGLDQFSGQITRNGQNYLFGIIKSSGYIYNVTHNTTVSTDIWVLEQTTV